MMNNWEYNEEAKQYHYFTTTNQDDTLHLGICHNDPRPLDLHIFWTPKIRNGGDARALYYDLCFNGTVEEAKSFLLSLVNQYLNIGAEEAKNIEESRIKKDIVNE